MVIAKPLGSFSTTVPSPFTHSTSQRDTQHHFRANPNERQVRFILVKRLRHTSLTNTNNNNNSQELLGLLSPNFNSPSSKPHKLRRKDSKKSLQNDFLNAECTSIYSPMSTVSSSKYFAPPTPLDTPLYVLIYLFIDMTREIELIIHLF